MRRVSYKELCLTLPYMGLYALHKRIWSWFPNQERRPYLYRHDQVADRYLVKLRMPSEQVLPDELEGYARRIEQKIEDGDLCGFSVRIVAETRDNRGAVATTPMNEQAGEWLSNRSAKWGFAVEGIDESTTRRQVFNGRNGRRIMLNDASITGQLRITDETLFDKALRHGIGRHKGFGYGLLDITMRGDKK